MCVFDFMVLGRMWFDTLFPKGSYDRVLYIVSVRFLFARAQDRCLGSWYPVAELS